jgi:hypothetical protein
MFIVLPSLITIIIWGSSYVKLQATEVLKCTKNFIALATDWKGNRNGCKMCQGTQQKEATGDQPKKSSLELSKFS